MRIFISDNGSEGQIYITEEEVLVISVVDVIKKILEEI